MVRVLREGKGAWVREGLRERMVGQWREPRLGRDSVVARASEQLLWRLGGEHAHNLR